MNDFKNNRNKFNNNSGRNRRRNRRRNRSGNNKKVNERDIAIVAGFIAAVVIITTIIQWIDKNIGIEKFFIYLSIFSILSILYFLRKSSKIPKTSNRYRAKLAESFIIFYFIGSSILFIDLQIGIFRMFALVIWLILLFIIPLLYSYWKNGKLPNFILKLFEKMEESESQVFSGKKNPRIAIPDHIYAGVIERAQSKCQFFERDKRKSEQGRCTYSVSRETLEVHHIDNDPSNSNNIENLILLCRNHHGVLQKEIDDIFSIEDENAFQEYKSRLKLYANNRFSDRSNAYEKDYSDQNYDSWKKEEGNERIHLNELQKKHCQTLEIDINQRITVQIIETAYIKLAKKYHPDSQEGDHEMMTLVNLAKAGLIKSLADQKY